MGFFMAELSKKQVEKMVAQLEKPVSKPEHQAQQRIQQQPIPSADKMPEAFDKHKYSGW